MDMYHIREVVDGGMLAHQHADLLDDVGSMGTVCMTAEDEASSLPVRRWGDEEIGSVNKNRLHPMHPMHPYICPVNSTNVAACSISSAFRSHRDLILKQGTTTGKCAAVPWL